MNTLKKRGAALLLALALTLGLAVPALAAAPAGETMAYTTDKILWVGPIPLAGLVVVKDEYYVPMEVLRETAGNIQCPIPLDLYPTAFPGDEGDCFTMNLSYSGNSTTPAEPSPCYGTPIS